MPRSIELPANFTPRPYQEPVMRFFDEGGKRAVWVMHRRGGKDRTMLAQVSKMALRRVGLYWHMLPTLKQARKAVWDNITGDGLKLIDATFPREIVRRVREDDMKIELANGSIVQLVGSDNFDSLVGANPVHITFSEFAIAHPRSWELMRPILAENGGTAAFISTPRGYNHLHTLLQYAKTDPAWFAEVMDVRTTGRLSDDDVAAEVRAGMPTELARQEFYCDFSAANVGSILGSRLEDAEREGRIADWVALDAAAPAIELVLDIGRNDATAVWCVQRRPDGYAVLGYDEDTGLAAEDWVERFNASGWAPEAIGRVWLPHDAWAKTFASRKSAAEQFHAAGFKCSRVPNLSKSDQINAARTVLRKCWFNASATEHGRMTLREWQFKYDETRRTYGREPDHNWASHCGDAFAYLAVAMQTAPAPERKGSAQFARPVHESFSLDELWSTAPQRTERIA